MFAENTGRGVIAYFIEMKIEYAKRYIREGNHNITQISQMLGYDKANYFSTQFKQYMKMTPSEYAASIKSLQGGDKLYKNNTERKE